MKKILIILMSIVCFVSLGIDIWYLYVMKYAPEKIISQTFEIGTQRIVTEEGTVDSKQFVEINLFDNVFELKFNYMLDEKQTAFYSQGVQFVSKNSKLDFSGDYIDKVDIKPIGQVKEDVEWFNNKYTNYSNIILGKKTYNTLNIYNYQSADNYETCLSSTNKIDSDTMFKIKIGDSLYGMKFKHTDIYTNNLIYNQDFYIGNETVQNETKVYGLWVDYHYDSIDYFRACDFTYFAELLYNSALSVAPGTSKILTFEFGDLFNYYEYDEEKEQYIDKTVSTDKASKITADVKSYYNIKVNRYEGVLQSSTQSIFNCYAGKMNYNMQNSFDEYFIGRTLVNVDINDFEFIETTTPGEYKLALSSNFRNYYYDYRGKIYLDIVIDRDYLGELNVTYAGIETKSLSDFSIYEITEIYNDIESEVSYV